MFVLNNHSKTKFMAEIKNEAGVVLSEFEMMDLSYNRWNEIGFMVTAQVAPKIKDPDNPSKYIDDFKQQQLYDGQADILRNAMRIVESIENGSGIDWGKDVPVDLHSKAQRLMNEVDTPVFIGLIGLLRNRAFGGKVDEKTAVAIFPDVPEKSRNGDPPEANDD